MPLGITLTLAVNLDIYNISRRAKRDKHHHVIDTGNTLTLGSHTGNLDIFQYRKFLTFSCHMNQNCGKVNSKNPFTEKAA